MEFDLSTAIPILERTPQVIAALLRDTPDGWTMNNEGGDSWSPFDVVGHLIHGEKTDWIPRAKIIMEYGPDKAFIPFDRFAQFEDSRGKTMNDLVAEFARLRQQNLETLQAMNLQPDDFERKGLHPALGEVTLGQLLATWVVHDLDHLHQIVRTMGKQYAGQVGAWGEYLGVLG